MARLWMRDVMSGSSVPTGAPGLHVLASTCLAWSMHAGEIYKPMTATQDLWASVPPKNVQCIIVRLVEVIGSTSNIKNY